MTMAIKSWNIIFDLDGTIIDSEVPLFEIWREVWADHGADLTLEYWTTFVGAANDAFDPFGDLQQRVDRELSRDEVQLRVRDEYHRRVNAGKALPGVDKIIMQTKDRGWRLALASSSEHEWIHQHLDRLEIKHHFDCIRGREDVEQAKPAPDLFLKAAEGLGVEPETCVVIEDSYNGLRAAKKAGMRAVVVPHRLTEKMDLSEADFLLRSLEEFCLSRL